MSKLVRFFVFGTISSVLLIVGIYSLKDGNNTIAFATLPVAALTAFLSFRSLLMHLVK